jgi:hypothetical protein
MAAKPTRAALQTMVINPLTPILGEGLGNWRTPLILRRVYDQTLGIRLRRTAPLHIPYPS